VNDLYEVWIMTKSQWPSFMSPFECAEAVEYGCRYIAIVCKKKSLKGIIQGQNTLLLLHLGSILISQFLCIFVDIHTSWWTWQYWINQKSYTWEDAAFITGHYIKIQSKSLDHGECICQSRQSSHWIDVLELHWHAS
jgi:hypothetical protein